MRRPHQPIRTFRSNHTTVEPSPRTRPGRPRWRSPDHRDIRPVASLLPARKNGRQLPRYLYATHRRHRRDGPRLAGNHCRLSEQAAAVADDPGSDPWPDQPNADVPRDRSSACAQRSLFNVLPFAREAEVHANGVRVDDALPISSLDRIIGPRTPAPSLLPRIIAAPR